MKIIEGSFQTPASTPAAGATLRLQLSQDALVLNTAQIAPVVYDIILDANGSVPAGTEIWANDELSPSGTIYRATLSMGRYGVIFGPQIWSLTGSSPIDLNIIVPQAKIPATQPGTPGNIVVPSGTLKQITGSFQMPNGYAAAGAVLSLKLSQDATVYGIAQIGQMEYIITLDGAGSIPTVPPTLIWGTDDLSPSGCYYEANLSMPPFGHVWGPEVWPIAGHSPIDTTNIAPNQPEPPAQIQIAGNITINGIPIAGEVLTATSPTTADWEVPQGGGGGDVIALVAGMNISSYQVVAVHADGLAYVADVTDLADAERVVGVAISSALLGSSIEVQSEGMIHNGGWTFVAGKQVFLGLGGALVQAFRVGVFEQPLGVAISASELNAELGRVVIYA